MKHLGKLSDFAFLAKMEDQACPKCKTTFFRNPNMKLLVNVCGHNLCESCVDLLFVRGKIIITGAGN